jgi:hypothetical protein
MWQNVKFLNLNLLVHYIRLRKSWYSVGSSYRAFSIVYSFLSNAEVIT